MRVATWMALLLGAGALAGCGNASHQLLGVPPTLQQSNLLAEQDLQDRMVAALVAKAGLTGVDLRSNPALWKDVADAGLMEVDIQCDRYLAALFTFNREQRAGRQVLTAAGAGTAAILGITGAAGTTVALVAAAFGLAANVFDAGANSVLFTVSPTAIRAVAAKGRQAFLEGIRWERVNSRPRMMMVVQGYLAQCTPAAIEANIDNAATGAPSVSNVDTALKAAALAAPSSTVVQDPMVFSASPVTPPRSVPIVIAPSNVARNVTATEAVFIRTGDEAAELQRALGVKDDGDLGPAGLDPPGETRRAILEFKLGQLRRVGEAGAGSDVIDRGSYRALLAGGPLPAGISSAFERGMLGDRPTCTSIRIAIGAVKGPVPAPDATPETCMKILRDAVAARRGQEGVPKPIRKPEALDSALFDAGGIPKIPQLQ
jgi:hypothetical protein